jgi:ribonuclease T1
VLAVYALAQWDPEFLATLWQTVADDSGPATATVSPTRTPQAAALEPTATRTPRPTRTPTPVLVPAQTDRPPAPAPTPTPKPQSTAAPTATLKPSPTANAPPSPTRASNLPTVYLADLPSEAHDTVALIDEGGPFPFRQDSTVFQNRERLLPRQAEGYYREYTVITPGEDDRGPRRIVAGAGGELYYTGDHYDSFREIIR